MRIANYRSNNSGQDYSSGGMLMPDRSFFYENYGFAFNGKIKDDEVKGEGNSYDYGYRMYDPRITRFLSVDPLTSGYPFYSPYQFSGNTPIAAVDIDGLEPQSVIDKNGKLTQPVIGFLQGAIDINKRVSESTLWMEGSRSAVWRWQKPNAITWNTTVFFDPSLQTNYDEHYWTELIGHEQTHRMQIDKMGWMPFAKSYLKEFRDNKKNGMDNYDAYHHITYEVEAYGQEAKLSEFFSDPKNNKDFSFILNDPFLSDNEKSEQLEVLGIEKVGIPGIEYMMQKVQTLISETDGKKKSAFLQGLYDQLGKDLQNKKDRVSNLQQKLNASE
jgi:RHS repeat-associated protein